MSYWSAVDIAWVAGIFEGEGWVSMKPGYNTCSLAVKMKDEDVVRRLLSVTGVGNVNGPDKHAMWTWQVGYSRDLARLLLAIAPLLGTRRKAQLVPVVERLMNVRRVRRPGSPIEHGSYAAYAYEKRRGVICQECRRAGNAYEKAGRQRRKDRLEAPEALVPGSFCGSGQH